MFKFHQIPIKLHPRSIPFNSTKSPQNPEKKTKNHSFPMVFPQFSHGFPTSTRAQKLCRNIAQEPPRWRPARWRPRWTPSPPWRRPTYSSRRPQRKSADFMVISWWLKGITKREFFYGDFNGVVFWDQHLGRLLYGDLRKFNGILWDFQVSYWFCMVIYWNLNLRFFHEINMIDVIWWFEPILVNLVLLWLVIRILIPWW